MTSATMPVACRNVDCDYLYIAQTADIQSFSLSANTAGSTLTITGTDFPDSIKHIFIGDAPCSGETVSATQITCTLDQDIVANNNLVPEVTGYLGLVASSAAAQDVAVTIGSVSPAAGLNLNGGTVLTVSGSAFPYSADVVSDDFSIAFSNPAGTETATCTVTSYSSTEIVCVPTAFHADSQDQTVTMTMTVNGNTATFNVGVTDSPAAADSVDPASVSPVLKDTLTITLTNDGGITLDEDDLTVYLRHPTDSTRDKILNVESVDNAANSLQAAFGGAWSETYTVEVVSASQGRFNSDISLHVGSTVTDYNPKTGSIYGGTLITIDGINFSDVSTDNPVGVGWDQCEIVSTSTTQIIARTPLRDLAEGETELGEEETFFIVALRTSEEADCTDCTFTYAEAETPTVTAVATSYDGEFHQMTFTGTGFGSSAELFLDGAEQDACHTVSATSATCAVTNLSAQSVATVDFIPQSGRPTDSSNVLTAGYSFSADFFEITSTEGS